MAIYDNNEAPLLAEDTIEEYLKAARICIETEKAQDTGSCYGMAAITLITCAIDAMGTFFENKSYIFNKDRVVPDLEKEKAKPHFEAFYDKLFKDRSGLDMNGFVNHIYDNIRCKSVHNGLLFYDYFLFPNKNKPNVWFEAKEIIKKDKDNTKKKYNIYLPCFLDAVENAYEVFKTLYDADSDPSAETNNYPNTGITNVVQSKNE